MSRTYADRMGREEALEKAVREQAVQRIARLMTSPDFRAYLHDAAFRRGRLEGLAPLGDEARALHEGRRALAYEMAQEALEVAPHEYVLMRREAIEEGLARLAQLQALEGGTP